MKAISSLLPLLLFSFAPYFIVAVLDDGFNQSPSTLTPTSSPSGPILEILGLIDFTWDWGQELFDFTMTLIDDHDDGWHDDILNDSTELGWSTRIENCSGTMALKEYWDFRTSNSGFPPHGVIGCRCSDSSVALASIATLEGVPQISPASTALELNDKEKFPFFARTVSPDASAIVAMMRRFSWQRISIIQTNNDFSNSLSSLFQQLWTGQHNDGSGEWEGEIAYSFTISLQRDGLVNEDSVRQALDGVPTDDPTINSRIIFLIAQPQHAFDILRIAAEANFQPDTVWVGPSAWANRDPPHGDKSWMKQSSGFIGVTPYRNRNEDYQDFLERFNFVRIQNDEAPWDDLPDYGAEQMVDSILALAMGLSALSADERRNGTSVMRKVLDLEFDGISGHVSFTPEGDCKDPLYTIFNFDQGNWKDVGKVGLEVGSASVDFDAVCFAEVDCGIVPTDVYPIPPARLPSWVVATISVIAVGLILVTLGYTYTAIKKKQIESQKKQIESQMTELQKKMEEMANIDNELVDVDKIMEEAKKGMASLIRAR